MDCIVHGVAELDMTEWLSLLGCQTGKPIVIYLFNFFSFCLLPAAWRILVIQPGIEPVPPAVEVWCLNHWTAKEVPNQLYFKSERVCFPKDQRNAIYISQLKRGRA